MFFSSDKQFKKIIKPIIRNKEFKKTYNIEHHGISRMEHLMKISFYSYKIAKKLKLDYEAVARGALLHDFYLDGDEREKSRRFLDTFTHPKKALTLSSQIFELNEMEKNIIVSHMFPFYFKLPRYKESILVDLVDKVIGSYEMMCCLKCRLKYKFNYLFLIGLIFLSNN